MEEQWIFLRGLVREKRHWGDFPQAFKKSFPRTKLTMMDLPGNGIYNNVTSPNSISETVKFIREILIELRIYPPYHLLAISLGGMISLEWMHQSPKEIQSSVLINTSIRGISPFYDRLRPSFYPSLIQMLSLPTSPFQREQIILNRTSNFRTGDIDLISKWSSYANEKPVSKRNALRQILAATRFKTPLLPEPIPTLILNSWGDRLVNSQCSQALAQHYNWPLITHPNAGHDLPLDAPNWILSRIEEWFNWF